MSLVRWTTKSLEHLVKALAAKGHQIKKSALADLLHDLGFSLRAAKKTIEAHHIPIGTRNFTTSKSNARSLNSRATRSFLLTVRKRN